MYPEYYSPVKQKKKCDQCFKPAFMQKKYFQKKKMHMVPLFMSSLYIFLFFCTLKASNKSKSCIKRAMSSAGHSITV